MTKYGEITDISLVTDTT